MAKCFKLSIVEKIFRVPIKEIHKMTEKQAIKEMKAVGFKLKQKYRKFALAALHDFY